MTVYCGVDFHARCQTVSYCDTADGELHQRELDHRRGDIRSFYAQFSGEVVVGIEASGYAQWFEQILAELGHQFLVGDATEIRRLAKRRQKNDRRDADHILDLLLKDEFPQVYRRPPESQDVLRQLRFRKRLVKITVMAKNNLHALATGAGLFSSDGLFSRAGLERLRALPLSPTLAHQRDEWLKLLEQLGEQLQQVEAWLRRQAAGDERVCRLRTHPGIGLLTGLALAHTLGDVTRFAGPRKVTAYVGLEPMEHSSAEQQRYGSISKAGSRLLRFLLGEAAQMAARHDDELRTFYQRLQKRRGKAKAVTATARKLLVRAFIMLRDGIDYAEFRRRGVEARSARTYT